MNIKPSDKTIREMLLSKKQFKIPRFQREYSWETKHYQEFLNDMLGNLRIVDGKIESSQYFLGTMLFIGDFSETTDKEIQVVDGQQRITTITILFSAMAERFKELQQNTLSVQLFNYIMGKDDNGDDVRVIITSTSHPFFAEFIQDFNKAYRNKPMSEEEQGIKDAYDFFKTQLCEEKIKPLLGKLHEEPSMASIQEISEVEILKALRDQVLGSLFVSISTTDRSEANRLFEILNGKGKRLAYIDLIKNKIFEVVDDLEPSDFASERWKELRSILNSAEEPEGLASFYRHYWISKYKNTSKNKLYDDFSRNIKKDRQKDLKNTYKDFLMDLVANSRHYMRCVNPSREQYSNRKEYFPLVQCLKNINTFGVVQTRVVMMALFEAKHKNFITCNELIKITQFLETFHFAYNAITRGRPNRIDSIYSKFAIALRKLNSPAEVKNLVQEELYSQLQKLIPAKEAFVKEFVQLTYSKTDNPINLKTRYALNQINSIYTKKPLFIDDSSVEHILPESDGDIALNIGNLILLERELNNTAGVKQYKDKLTIYAKSSYESVKQFISEHHSWEISEISSRASLLASKFYDHFLNNKIL